MVTGLPRFYFTIESMEFIPDKFDLALMLWDRGIFLATHFDEERISLYKYNNKFYVMWYNEENHLNKIEIVSADTAKEMFKDYAF
jgi:hypothetical protein